MSTPKVNHVLGKTSNPQAEECPVCKGTWFVVCHKIYLGFPNYQLTADVTDEDHRADEGFACVKCGTVILQDRSGNLAIELNGNKK